MADDQLLTSEEVADRFRVDVKTVQRWARPQRGNPPQLKSIRTPGGQFRFYESEVQRFLNGNPESTQDGAT